MIWGKTMEQRYNSLPDLFAQGQRDEAEKKNEAGEILVTLIEATYDNN